MLSAATRIARGSAYLVAQNIVATVVGVVALAFMARLLTRVEMGVTVALTLVGGLSQLVSDLGFGGALAKFVAEWRGRGADYASLAFTGLTVKGAVAVLFAVFCFSMSSSLSRWLLGTGEYAILFQLLSVNVPLACLFPTMDRVLLGLDKIREMAVLNTLRISVRQSLVIALLLFGWGLPGVVIGWVLGDLVYVVSSSFVMIKGRYLRSCRASEVGAHFKMLVKFSWPLFLVAVVAFVYAWFDRAVLLASVPLGELAVYNVAYMAYWVLATIPDALGTVLFPYYSERYGKNEHKAIEAGVRSSSRYVALVFTPLALGLASTATAAITLFAGSQYASGGAVLMILSVFGALTCVGASFGGLLTVYGMTRSVLLVNVASVVGGLALSPVLLAALGVAGMALVRGVSMVISFALVFVILRRRIAVEVDVKAVWKSLASGLVMAAVVVLIEAVWFDERLLPLYVVAGGVVYALMLRSLKAVDAQDIGLVKLFLPDAFGGLIGGIARLLGVKVDS